MMREKTDRTEDQWRSELTPEQFRVLREKGTERAFSGQYWNTKTPGVYKCAGCGNELFTSETKFDSGCGWPSFTRPVVPAFVNELRDASHGMLRTEVRSVHGDSHLGHVFPDGPRDRGGLRYCINSASLRFVLRGDMQAEGYGEYLNQVKES